MRCFQRWQLVGLSFVKDPRSAKLMDLLLVSPFLIGTGFYKTLPMNARVACIVAGSILALWNGLGILIEDHLK